MIPFSFWFLALPAYLCFSTLDDLDSVSSSFYLQSIEQEDPIPGSENKEKILNSSPFIKDILIVHLSLAWTRDLPDQLPALNSESLILRC